MTHKVPPEIESLADDYFGELPKYRNRNFNRHIHPLFEETMKRLQLSLLYYHLPEMDNPTRLRANKTIKWLENEIGALQETSLIELLRSFK